MSFAAMLAIIEGTRLRSPLQDNPHSERGPPRFAGYDDRQCDWRRQGKQFVRRSGGESLMKIYTKTGDDGSTGLFGGQRVSKADPRIECYGTVDELNAAIGSAAAAATDAELRARLLVVQTELFDIGAHLATPPEQAKASAVLPPLDVAMIERLERQIDAADATLPPLRNFILPGGSEAACRLHVARTICRRAERAVVEFSQLHKTPPIVITYLNRLSDWLFVEARLANHGASVADVLWSPRK